MSAEGTKVVSAQSDGDCAVGCWNSKDIAGSSASGSVSVDDTDGNKLVYPEVVNKHDDDEEEEEDEQEDDDSMDDSDDEELSDDFDFDTSEKNYDTYRTCKWFREFFESLDALSLEEVNSQERQWHCPACQFGPGAINWYQGLKPLITHARTKGRKRVKLHRVLAELLEKEVRQRGAPIILAGEAFGQWKGLTDVEKDHLIVWPPMVVIMNTRLELDVNGQWVGMGSQELRDHFSSYGPFKAKHSYGPQGHRGISILIFESNAGGYLEAERLHRQFVEQASDRKAWGSSRRNLFGPGGKRQLYGYMAEEKDLVLFNQHLHGKYKVKCDLKSYTEMVVNQIRQMTNDNHKLGWFQNKVAIQETRSKTLEKTLGDVSMKLRKTMEENRIVKQRSKVHHEKIKEELDSQEQFYKSQIGSINEARDASEEMFEKLQLEEREKIQELNVDPSNIEEYKRRVEEISNRLQLQDKEMEDFVAEREDLIKEQEDKIAATKRRFWEEMVRLEKAFDAQLAQLMKKYAPNHSDGASTA